MKKQKSVIFLLFCFTSCITFGQNNFKEIKNNELTKILLQGFDSSENLMRNSQPNYPKKSISFRFDYSNVRLVNSDNSPMFYFTGSDTSVYKIDNIDEIRYSYLYSYKKIEIDYSILYYPNKNAKFLRKSTESELRILSQLENGECTKCFKTVENFIKIAKIKNYKLAIETTNIDATEISSRFLWKVIEKKSNGLNNLFFVSPVTGKKVDTNKMFVAPRLK
jgi:hypothetical protein